MICIPFPGRGSLLTSWKSGERIRNSASKGIKAKSSPVLTQPFGVGFHFLTCANPSSTHEVTQESKSVKVTVGHSVNCSTK